jgi:hypothetical protein
LFFKSDKKEKKKSMGTEILNQKFHLNDDLLA